MRQLESKRDCLESLGVRLIGKSSGHQTLLQSRLGVLRDQLDVTKVIHKHHLKSKFSNITPILNCIVDATVVQVLSYFVWPLRRKSFFFVLFLNRIM